MLKPECQYVGLLVPPSVGGVLANTALTLAGKVTVNLNYTLTDDVVNYCIREAGIKQVITSRAFMEKRPMKLDAELVYLEDLKKEITSVARARAFVMARFYACQFSCQIARPGTHKVGRSIDRHFLLRVQQGNPRVSCFRSTTWRRTSTR